MKSEKSHSEPNRPSSVKPQFGGSVELIPSRPTFIEFITANRLWGLPLRRLELLLDPLMNGRVKRVHGEKFPGTPMIEEPWVSEIKIIPRYEAIPW
jgi:hypothetical protein